MVVLDPIVWKCKLTDASRACSACPCSCGRCCSLLLLQATGAASNMPTFPVYKEKKFVSFKILR